MQSFYRKLSRLPNGTYDVLWREKRYLLHKTTLLQGRVIKLFARSLSDDDIVSANIYPHIKEGLLKPCEMSATKVIDFVESLSVLESPEGRRKVWHL